MVFISPHKPVSFILIYSSFFNKHPVFPLFLCFPPFFPIIDFLQTLSVAVRTCSLALYNFLTCTTNWNRVISFSTAFPLPPFHLSGSIKGRWESIQPLHSFHCGMSRITSVEREKKKSSHRRNDVCVFCFLLTFSFWSLCPFLISVLFFLLPVAFYQRSTLWCPLPPLDWRLK